jgi:thymidylate kinase
VRADSTDRVPTAMPASDGFTSALRAFFIEARTWPWSTRFPRAVFIRDFEGLPDTSPHDIDLLVDADCHDEFLRYVSDRAGANGLCCTTWTSGGGCFALIADLNLHNKGRAWAFLEGRDTVRVTDSCSISAADLEIVRDGRTGLPVPSDRWKTALTILHGVRTGRRAQVRARLAQSCTSIVDAVEILAKRIGFDRASGKNPEDLDAVFSALSDVGVRAQKAPAASRSAPGRGRLRRFVFCELYFLHLSSPWFFSIHGPDGVGKSTVCRHVRTIFERLPIAFNTFHHVTGWKYPTQSVVQAADTESATPSKSRRAGLLHSALRGIYRLMPPTLQELYVAAQSYDLYLRKLGRLQYEKHVRDEIMLVDRYIYDLATKNRINERGWRPLHWLFVWAARPPHIAFVLADRPENIYRRKQELTIDEIRRYSSTLTDVLRSGHVRSRVIDVSGRPPERIAMEVAAAILERCKPAIPMMLRNGKAAT